MNQRVDPDEGKGKHDRGSATEDTFRIFSESHGGESDGCGKAYRGGNKTRHEPKRGMINSREKMIFASRSRQSWREFAVTKRAAERDNSTGDPEKNQGEA